MTEHPADFANWVGRRSDKLRHDGRPAWQPLADQGQVPRVAALVHVFYLDLLPEILRELANIPVPFDLIVTNASGQSLQLAASQLPKLLRNVRVLTVPNHGRDILPMISVVNAGLLEPYELVLKVHTKKSEWRESHVELSGSGDEWRENFLSGLLGNVERVERILSGFADDPSLGLLTADGCIVGPEHWGGNRARTEALLRRLELLPSRLPLKFASGSMYWVRAFVLNGLRALDLAAVDFEEERGQIDGTTAHAVERIIGELSLEAGFALREVQELTSPSGGGNWRRYLPGDPRPAEARVYPFYLPQFHAFPENDSWWGRGFTEWNNVASAKPVFEGHRQPLLPSDLGYYDLSDPSLRARQYALAQHAGIEGFMYYYYWFAGKRLMDMPVEQLAASADDHPFCLMWANENWTRRWDGGDENVLIAQDYEQVPATQFIEDVRHLITDPRFLRIEGKPVIAVYRITQIPNFPQVLEYWRQRATDFGLPGLTLLTVDVGAVNQGIDSDIVNSGLDGTLEFPPHNRRWVHVTEGMSKLEDGFSGATLRYDVVAEDAETKLLAGLPSERFPGVMVAFDNTARRQDQSHIYYGANPYTFRRWLRSAVFAVQNRPEDERVIFINAWNEWAEGAVLEPTQRFGRSYLQAVRSAVTGF